MGVPRGLFATNPPSTQGKRRTCYAHNRRQGQRQQRRGERRGKMAYLARIVFRRGVSSTGISLTVPAQANGDVLRRAMSTSLMAQSGGSRLGRHTVKVFYFHTVSVCNASPTPTTLGQALISSFGCWRTLVKGIFSPRAFSMCCKNRKSIHNRAGFLLARRTACSCCTCSYRE